MAKHPQFPFFVRDWLCSRRVLSMSGNSVKAYVYLLAESWLQIPRATLPVSDQELSSMARISLNEWIVIKNEVLQHFFEGKCKEHKGRLYNELLLEISRKCENKQRFNNKNAKRSQIKHKQNAAPDNDTDNDTDTDLSSDFPKEGIQGGKSENKIIPPLLEWIQKYCVGRNNGIDPKYFFDKYTGNGWMIGKSKMKDWQATIRTWEKNGYNTGRSGSGQRQGCFGKSNAGRPGYDSSGNALGAASKPGEFDEGIITLEGVPDHR
jgi:uncharacterized protein YdaU (DUF1376 family)